MNRDVSQLIFRADLLRERIRECGLSQRRVAEKMSISEKTFSLKMNGVYDWTLSEVQQLSRILTPLDSVTIFNI